MMRTQDEVLRQAHDHRDRESAISLLVRQRRAAENARDELAEAIREAECYLIRLGDLGRTPRMILLEALEKAGCGE